MVGLSGASRELLVRWRQGWSVEDPRGGRERDRIGEGQKLSQLQSRLTVEKLR